MTVVIRRCASQPTCAREPPEGCTEHGGVTGDGGRARGGNGEDRFSNKTGVELGKHDRGCAHPFGVLVKREDTRYKGFDKR